jgi:hypothetical protein
MITVSLLAMGCDDSTGPSSGETTTSRPAAEAPTSPGGPFAGSGQVPDHVSAEAPKLLRGNPLDTATSGVRPAFLTRSNATYNPNWTTGMPTVRIPLGAVQCVANIVGTAGIDVSATGGKSILFNQHVVGETWFYRWNGTAWASYPVKRTELALHGTMLAAPFGTVPGTSLGLVYPGYYSAITRLTWFAQLNDGRWVQTATATYSFDKASDYAVALGATAGPGYCKAP